jgi:Mrp family chromosome partitioning ATPase
VEGAILVTSPRGGEGKTFCAINMALALGEAWQSRVLLLEADFRNPSLARLLGFQPPACIARQLERDLVPGAHTWDVAEVLVPWLHAAVVNPDNSYSPELDGPSLRVCVEDSLRAGYDYIVIDTPPVLGTADVNLVEASVGGIVMVLRAGHSRARDFRAAVEQIGTTKLLGVIWLAG